ncbi:MAG: radical SAM protein [Clostridiales bacterium]|jgi:putative pyruvate formate lyase activating enzyme|nr:radical SAM protein [Clostridiales bacterium]
MSCNLCPRNCGVDRASAAGYCGAGCEPEIALCTLHKYEEPCISGADPARGSGAVFFRYCNLKCVYCQNYKISLLSGGLDRRGRVAQPPRFGRGEESRPVAQPPNFGRSEESQPNLSDLPAVFLALQAKGAYNINLVTPTHYAPQIAEAVFAAKQGGLTVPVVWNTGNYEKAETIEKYLSGAADIYLPDMKYFESETAARYSNAPDYFRYADKALRAMVKLRPRPVFGADGLLKSGVLARHMLLPGHLAESMKIVKYLHTEFGGGILISLMSQYTPMPGIANGAAFPELQNRVSARHYKTLVEYAAGLGIKNAYTQGRGAAGESCIPNF